MSKVTYVLINPNSFDVGIGSAGVLAAGATRTLTVEEDGDSDYAISSAVANFGVTVYSATSAAGSASPPRSKTVVCAWAARPLTGNLVGDLLRATDIGPAPGTFFTWNGSRWRPQNGRAVLAHTSVPVVLPSSGSSNATGSLTITTALGFVPSGTVGVYLPAAVVVGDATGGVKQATFTTTQAAQLVGSPVTANAAYTQTTGSPLTLASLTLPAGLMGANSMLKVDARWATLNNANAKSLVVQLGAGVSLAQSIASAVTGSMHAEIRNRGATNVQLMTPSLATTPYGATTQALIAAGSVDTSVASSVKLTMQLATATDWMILEGYSIELIDA